MFPVDGEFVVEKGEHALKSYEFGTGTISHKVRPIMRNMTVYMTLMLEVLSCLWHRRLGSSRSTRSKERGLQCKSFFPISSSSAEHHKGQSSERS